MTLNSFKKINPSMLWLISLGTILAGVTMVYTVSQMGNKPQETSRPAEVAPLIPKITALGRIEPKTEVIKVSAPLIFNSDRVARLLIEEGDAVKAGQAIAILESRERLEDSFKQAQEEIKVAQAKLEQVQAGAKTGEIDAQSSTIRRLEAQLIGERASQEATLQRLEAQLEGEISAQKVNILKLQAEFTNANAEYKRYKQLVSDGAISASEFDSKEVTYETSRQLVEEAKVNLERIERTGQKQIQEAKANLERIKRTGQQQVREASSTLDKVAEVRSVDVKVLQAQVDQAIAASQKVKTELDQSYIRAPIAGQILKIYARPSEEIGDDGILDMGETQQMEVVAEIYQSDISAIKVGQKATVTGESFQGQLQGKVRLIGMRVNQQNVFSNEPGENLDRKVIDVRIQLDPQNSEKVKSLTNSQVTVALEK